MNYISTKEKYFSFKLKKADFFEHLEQNYKMYMYVRFARTKKKEQMQVRVGNLIKSAEFDESAILICHKLLITKLTQIRIHLCTSQIRSFVHLL